MIVLGKVTIVFSLPPLILITTDVAAVDRGDSQDCCPRPEQPGSQSVPQQAASPSSLSLHPSELLFPLD